MNILIRQSYFGADEARRVVMDVTSRRVLLMHPTTCERYWITRAEFTEWCKGSDRRSYRGDEDRTKLGTGPELDEDLNETGRTLVHYVTAERRHEIVSVPEDEWLAWRETAE